MFDGDVAAVAHPDAGVDGPEAALAENLAHLVGALERLAVLVADGGIDILEKTWKCKRDSVVRTAFDTAPKAAPL